jgi:ABC-type branched-subunit amino acid transport system ATPase component
MNQKRREDMAAILDVTRVHDHHPHRYDMGVVMDISMRVAVLDMGQKIAGGWRRSAPPAS